MLEAGTTVIGTYVPHLQGMQIEPAGEKTEPKIEHDHASGDNAARSSRELQTQPMQSGASRNRSRKATAKAAQLDEGAHV